MRILRRKCIHHDCLEFENDYCRCEKRDNLGGFIQYLVNYDEVKAYPFSELWFDIGSAWHKLIK